MKKLIFLFIPMLFLIVGCVTVPTRDELANLDYDPTPQHYQATIKGYFDNILFDPYSAYYGVTPPVTFWYKAGGHLHAGYLVLVEVNAKNRFGGYVGKKRYGIVLKNEQIIKV